jgi:hypothetical protein
MTFRISAVAVWRSRASFVSLKQAHVLDRNHRLVGEGLHELELLGSSSSRPLVDGDDDVPIPVLRAEARTYRRNPLPPRLSGDFGRIGASVSWNLDDRPVALRALTAPFGSNGREMDSSSSMTRSLARGCRVPSVHLVAFDR